MIIWSNSRTDVIKIRKDTIIRKKICENNIHAIQYCNKVRKSGRKAWIDSNVCYYI